MVAALHDFALALLELCSRFAVALQSLCSRFAVALQWLCSFDSENNDFQPMPSNSKSVQTLSIIRVSKISEIRFLKINDNKLETNDDDKH